MWPVLLYRSTLHLFYLVASCFLAILGFLAILHPGVHGTLQSLHLTLCIMVAIDPTTATAG
jgi:hypothetical protein